MRQVTARPGSAQCLLRCLYAVRLGLEPSLASLAASPGPFVAGLCETFAYGSAMVFDIAMGSWLKGPDGYSKMMSTLLICSVAAVIFMGGFMQQEKVYEDNLLHM